MSAWKWARGLGVSGLLGAALAMVVHGQPISAWVGALICALFAASQIVSAVGDRLTADIARTRALTESMKAADDTATRLERAGELEQAIGALEAGQAIGELTEEGHGAPSKAQALRARIARLVRQGVRSFGRVRCCHGRRS